MAFRQLAMLNDAARAISLLIQSDDVRVRGKRPLGCFLYARSETDISSRPGPLDQSVRLEMYVSKRNRQNMNE